MLLSVWLLYCTDVDHCCSVYADYSYYTATDVDHCMLHVAQCMLIIVIYYTATDVDHCMLHVDRHHPGTQCCWWTGLLLHIQR